MKKLKVVQVTNSQGEKWLLKPKQLVTVQAIVGKSELPAVVVQQAPDFTCIVKEILTEAGNVFVTFHVFRTDVVVTFPLFIETVWMLVIDLMVDPGDAIRDAMRASDEETTNIAAVCAALGGG